MIKSSFLKQKPAVGEKAVQQYQQLVLGGVNQIGIVKELGGNFATVSYPDGWELPCLRNILLFYLDSDTILKACNYE